MTIGFATLALATVASVIEAGDLLLHAWSGKQLGTLQALLVAASLYCGSQGLRVVRLFVLLITETRKLAAAASAHLTATIAGMVLPFKLGDALRIIEIGRVCGSVKTGVSVVLLERALDAAALIGLIALTSGAWDSAFQSTLFGTAALVLVAAAAATAALPQFFTLLRRIAVTHSRSGRSLVALEWINGAQNIRDRLIRLVSKRSAALIFLTLLIWVLEGAAATVALDRTFTELGENRRGVDAMLHSFQLLIGPKTPFAADQFDTRTLAVALFCLLFAPIAIFYLYKTSSVMLKDARLLRTRHRAYRRTDDAVEPWKEFAR
jgi:hypothetical protein